KARPVQTYLRPDRRWIFGRGAQVYRIYYYKYFDQAENVMNGLQVFDLDRETFRLRRHISAEKARWEPSLGRWVFQNGWMRELEGSRAKLNSFMRQTATFPELDEPPGYFLREVKQEKQMNFHQLETYIRELQQGGFDTIRLQVQYHKKFAVP